MKQLLVIILLTAAAWLPANAQKVYSTGSAYQADIKVYVVEHEYQADLVVYKTDRPYRAEKKTTKASGTSPTVNTKPTKKYIS